MNNSILNDVLKEYEKKRLSNTYKLEKRKQELYTSNPELKEIDNKLSEFSINTAKCILQNNSEKYLKDLKKEVQFLKNKKINILKKAGLSEDYLLPIYDCKICKDTGYVFENGQTKMCNCLKQKLYNIEYNEKNMTYIKNQTFDNFNINLFFNIITAFSSSFTSLTYLFIVCSSSVLVSTIIFPKFSFSSVIIS